MNTFDPESFVVPSIRELPKSGIREFFDLVSQRKDLISLGVGEPDFVTPESIRAAAIASLHAGGTKYTSNAGTIECRTAITRYLHKFYGLDYDPEEECLVTIGVSEALDLAIRALVNPGDEVIYISPCFVSYPTEVLMAHGVPVPLVTVEADNFSVNPQALRALITPKSKILLLNSPNNPTGAVTPTPVLREIAQIAVENNLIVIADEIYSELVFDHYEITSIAALPGMRERTIFMHGFSKAFAMTGFRIGYVCATKVLIQAMFKIHQYAVMCTPTIAQTAAVASLAGERTEVDIMRRSYEKRRNMFIAGLREAGLPCVTPQGAFYAFPRISDTGLSSREFAERLLNQEGVAVVPGSAFGPGGEGYVRCCYATAIEQLETALKKIRHFTAGL